MGDAATLTRNIRPEHEPSREAAAIEVSPGRKPRVRAQECA